MTGLMAVTLAITAFVVGVAYGVAGATWLVIRLREDDENAD